MNLRRNKTEIILDLHSKAFTKTITQRSIIKLLDELAEGGFDRDDMRRARVAIKRQGDSWLLGGGQ